MARLTKHDVEALLGAYDTEPVGALTIALRSVLDAPADAQWPDLIARAPITDSARAALMAGETAALDALAAQLNESRELSSG